MSADVEGKTVVSLTGLTAYKCVFGGVQEGCSARLRECFSCTVSVRWYLSN